MENPDKVGQDDPSQTPDWFAQNAPTQDPSTQTPPDTAGAGLTGDAYYRSIYPTPKDYLLGVLGGYGANAPRGGWSQLLGEVNRIYGLGTGQQAVYDASKGTYGAFGLPQGYISYNDGNWTWTDRGPDSGSGAPISSGTIGDLVAPYTTTFKQFTQPGGGGYIPFQTKPFTLPSGQDVLNQDPGYQFRLGQGEQALQQSAAAKGLLNTGGTLKDILNYGQSAASQEYQDAANRAFNVWGANAGLDTSLNSALWNQYLQNYNVFTGNQNNAFDKLYKQETLGASTAGA